MKLLLSFQLRKEYKQTKDKKVYKVYCCHKTVRRTQILYVMWITNCEPFSFAYGGIYIAIKCTSNCSADRIKTQELNPYNWKWKKLKYCFIVLLVLVQVVYKYTTRIFRENRRLDGWWLSISHAYFTSSNCPLFEENSQIYYFLCFQQKESSFNSYDNFLLFGFYVTE